MLQDLYLVLCSHYASPLQHCAFCMIHTLKTVLTRNIIVHLDKRFLMYLIRWENNLQLPENILSNRFSSRQHDVHKKCTEQKLGETDAVLNTSLKKITISPCTANGNTCVISTKCNKTVHLQPQTTVLHSLTL